jgi:hypothetical protein
MTDDELRALLEQAHSGDTPPPLGALVAEARARAARPRRPWRAGVVAVAVAVGLAALVALALRPHPRPESARLDVVAGHAPLDFLLDVPGTDLLRDTPRFDLTVDLKGTLP